jgi:prepilin-type N-terminal cleavage/methylation domain-containing protein
VKKNRLPKNLQICNLTLHRRGFSLIELLVMLAIIGIMTGLAVTSFIGLSRVSRLDTAAESVNQVMLHARQQAITSQESRRVALNFLTGEFYTERKLVASPRNKLGEVWSRATQVEKLPENIRLTDVNGQTELYFQGQQGVEPVWYVEFDPQGWAIHYPNGANQPITSNLALHFANDIARIPLGPGQSANYQEILETGIHQPLIGSIWGMDLNNDGNDDGNPSVAAEIAAEARRQVVTVYLLRLTGRTRIFKYGYGFPWSDRDVDERT